MVSVMSKGFLKRITAERMKEGTFEMGVVDEMSVGQELPRETFET